MRYLLSLDQGTSSSRAIVYTLQGKIIANHRVPIQCNYPKTGWVEQDPNLIVASIIEAIKGVFQKVSPKDILCCGITNQRETTLIWDKKTGQTLGPAIVWQDRRTKTLCEEKNLSKDWVKEKTGLCLDPYFSASKIEWLLNQNPSFHKKAEQGELLFGTVDTFLLWTLSRGRAHKTDVTNASRTLLLNLKTLAWDEDLLKLFRIPQQMLPEVVASDAYFGHIDASFFGVEIPIHGILGDQQAALLGQVGIEAGSIKATYGTGGFLLLNTAHHITQSSHGLLSTVAYQIKNEIAYGLEGSIYQAGSIVKWLKENLGIIKCPEETQMLAQSLSSNEGVYLVPAFTGLAAPYWINEAGGILTGLTRATTKAHIARAALESIVYQTQDILQCMQEDTQLSIKTLRVDGGVSQNEWFLNFLAEVCNLDVQKPKDIELTSKGAALVAALGIGAIAKLQDINSSWHLERDFFPQKTQKIRETDYKGWQKAVTLLLQDQKT